ncbi:MAG: glycosyltransferase [Clostridia bacterium]|nr:glycosyltransferase [Clostridia bacterium]
MTTISLCMIVKNEEDVLKRCLESVQDITDEIIIVDTGSTDNTKKIAKEFTNKIYHFSWVDDFAKARNYSFSKATKDYILWLDADDVILPKDKEKFKEFKKTLDKNIDIVMMKYNCGFDSEGNPTLSYYRERLIKNFKNYTWIGRIHEVIPPTGNVIYSDVSITHKKIHRNDPNRNLRIFEKMIKDNTPFDTRQKFYYAREVYYSGDYPKAIEKFNDFLNSDDKWVENTISALLDLSTCYHNIGDKEHEIQTLFKSFEFSTPRSQTCCYIGNFFLKENKIDLAIYWYELALTIKPDLKSGGFFEMDYYHFIPYIQLCVCYYKLGNIQKSIEYNELAGKIKPNNTLYLKNKEFFENFT